MNPTTLFLCLAVVFGGAFTALDCRAGITYPTAPDGGEEAVSNALNSKFLKHFTHLPPIQNLTVARPYQVYWYVINYTNILSGGFLSAIQFAGWQFWLADGTNTAGLLLRYDEKNRTWADTDTGPVFYPIRPGVNHPVLQTLRAAEKLPQVKNQDYEFRYVDFTQTSFNVVWLHNKSSDIFIPVPLPGKWQDYRPYSESEITGLLQQQLEEQMNRPPYQGSGIPVD